MDRISNIKGFDILTLEEMEKVKELAPILFALEEKCKELGLNHVHIENFKYSGEIAIFDSAKNEQKFNVALINHFENEFRITKRYFEGEECVRSISWEGDE